MGPLAMIAGGAVLGGLTNWLEAKTANSPTKQQTIRNPADWTSGPLKDAVGWGNTLFNPANSPYIGPSQYTLDFANWASSLAGGFGGGFGGGIGKDWQPATEYIKGLSADPTAYESDVLAGKYLDLDSNKYFQDYMASLRADAGEEHKRMLAEAIGPGLGAGATLGMGGANTMARMKLSDSFGENLDQALAAAYSQTYGGERALMDSVNQALSGRTMSLQGNAAQAYAANTAARGNVAAAKAAAAPGVISARWNQIADVYNMYRDIDAAYARNALLPQEMNLNWLGALTNTGSAFGTDYGKITPPQTNAALAGLLGAFGGGLAGYGASGSNSSISALLKNFGGGG